MMFTIILNIIFINIMNCIYFLKNLFCIIQYASVLLNECLSLQIKHIITEISGVGTQIALMSTVTSRSPGYRKMMMISVSSNTSERLAVMSSSVMSTHARLYCQGFKSSEVEHCLSSISTITNSHSLSHWDLCTPLNCRHLKVRILNVR